MLQTLAKLLLVGLLSGLLAIPSMAATIYFAPTAQGAGNGTSAANAYAWTDATHGITGATASWVAGNTLYLSGAYGAYNCSAVGGVGNNGVVVGGSGTSGSHILVQGDTVTPINMTCPAWGAAIYCAGSNSYIDFDGGASGLLQSTDNGSPGTYTNSLNSGGVDIHLCNHTEIRNWSVQNMYITTGGSDTLDYGYGVATEPGSDYVSVHGINALWGAKGILIFYETLSSAVLYNNTTDYNRWGIIVIDNDGSSTAANVSIYGNNVGPHFAAWHDSTCYLHMDGITVSASNPPSASMTNVQIYNNFARGDGLACDATGYITLFGGISNAQIFNNVIGQIVNTSCPESLVRMNNGSQPSSNITFVNNTIFGDCTGVKTDVITNLVAENNVFNGVYDEWYQDPANNNSFSTANYNDFYNFNYMASNNNGPGPPTVYNTLANWQAATIAGGVHPDLNSVQGNPLINGSAPPYYPTTGTAATGGANLTSLSITALNSDAPYTFGTGYACGSGCTARPSSGTNNWPMGAYQVNGSPPPPSVPSAPCPQCFVLLPPTDLRVLAVK